MAMPFGNLAIDALHSRLMQAVSETGFDLRRLDEKPKAGLIDDHLRVEIRTSRFLVVDLTDGNQGAYWEAGFGESLGKHVFYSCEKAKLHQQRTHFDANHSYTLLWNSDDLEGAAAELKAAIRATLPDEAKMQDE